jgi:hypothetical protein
MATGSALDRLARAIKQSGTGTSPAWLPRPAQMTMHQGILTSVDNANGHVDFQFPDPLGLVVPAVRTWQAYSANHLPQVGHVAWGIHYGTDFVVMGQHIPPISPFITPV